MLLSKKFELSYVKFIYLFATINLLLFNYPLMKYAILHIEKLNLSGFFLFVTTIVASIFITALILLILGFFGNCFLKVFAIAILLINSVVLYFMLNYEVILTKAMMGNVFNTNTAESSELLSLKIIFYLLFLGILPSFFIAKIEIKKTKFIKKLLDLFLTIASILIYGFATSFSWAWIDKNAKNIGGLILPWSYIGNSIRYGIEALPNKEVELLSPLSFKDPNAPEIVVLVIGESARADRFGVLGYQRETTPRLAKEKLHLLKNTISCKTYTTAGIACMLRYEGSKSSIFSNDEPLPSYLERFGVNTLWRSNNWGEMPLKISKYQKANDIRKEIANPDGWEFDMALLYNLKDEIASLKSPKKFIVLHQTGSHGPAYSKKYPKRVEKFGPVCDSVELKNCTKDELNNAYDNTIIWTDHFLGELIAILKSINTPSVMIYLSDHGESLGENNFFLHGAPNAIAPKEQRNIPFIIWTSSERKFKPTIDSYSQDFVFHTVLGAFGATSKEYNSKFDLFE